MSRISLLSRALLALLFAISLALPGMALGQNDDGTFKKRGRRRGKIKSIRLKIKKKNKLIIKVRKKETARSKQDAAAAAKAKQKTKAIDDSAVSASKYADEQAAKLRMDKIKRLEGVLKMFAQLPAGSDGGRGAEIRYQLAEEYWEHAKYLRFQAMAEHNKLMSKWDVKCRKVGIKKCGKAPQPNLLKSNVYRNSAVGHYKLLLKKNPNYKRADEVRFYLASNLMETKKFKAGVKEYLTLIKKAPSSRFVPDAYVALGNHYFNKNKVLQAQMYYKKAMETSEQRFKNPRAPQETKIRKRGLHLRSMYMLGWCDFNEGSYDRAINRFKTVVKLSMRYEKSKESRVILKSESLRDMIRVFAKMNQPKVHLRAWNYFKKSMGRKFAYVALKKLARRLYSQGSNETTIETYRFLLGLNKKGIKDRVGSEAPIFQNEIVRTSERALYDPAKVYGEVKTLLAYLEDDSRWMKKWRSNKSVQSNAKDTVEQTLLEYSTSYHQRAQKAKKPKKRERYYDYAAKLYEEYLRYYPEKDSAYELRFFLAELKYRKADKIRKARRGRLNKEAKQLFANAAYHYRKIVVQKPKGQYMKQAAFSEVLCYEALANRSGNIKLSGKRLKGLKKDKNGQVIWKKDKVRKWDKRLLQAYRDYLKVARKKEDRLQTYFKIGTIYYSYKHYLKSMSIFSAMAREFPNHELSRRAAFMILYSYEDLGQWPELEANARLFIKDKTLTKNKVFRKEMYEMIIRSSYLRIFNDKKFKGLNNIELAARFATYEKEFGKEGPWLKKGFAMSPKAVNALSLAGFHSIKGKRILDAIKHRKRLVDTYPTSKFYKQMLYDLGGHYEQIARYKVAVGYFERYVFGKKDYMKADDDQPKTKKRRRRKRRRRRRRRRRSKKASASSQAALAKVVKKQTNNALFKAARYRRGLDNFDRAIALYREYIKRYKDDKEFKDVPQMYLNIATLFEERKMWDKTITAYNDYLANFQPKPLTSYLDYAVKLYNKDLIKEGSVKTLAKIAKSPRGRRVKKDMTSNDKLLVAHVRIARAHAKKKNTKEMVNSYARANALGYKMIEYKNKAMLGDSLARRGLAESKFYLAEQRRAHYETFQFPATANQYRLKKALKKVVVYGATVKKDYVDVAPLKIAKWNLAAFYRSAELTHLFVKKLYRYAENPPKSLPKRLRLPYRIAMETFAGNYEESAIDAYVKVLNVSANMGIYNQWIRLCEDSLNQLRKKKKINALTIFSKRRMSYTTITPLMAKVKLRKKKKRVIKLKRKKYLPGKIKKVNLMK